MTTAIPAHLSPYGLPNVAVFDQDAFDAGGVPLSPGFLEACDLKDVTCESFTLGDHYVDAQPHGRHGIVRDADGECYEVIDRPHWGKGALELVHVGTWADALLLALRDGITMREARALADDGAITHTDRIIEEHLGDAATAADVVRFAQAVEDLENTEDFAITSACVFDGVACISYIGDPDACREAMDDLFESGEWAQ